MAEIVQQVEFRQVYDGSGSWTYLFNGTPVGVISVTEDGQFKVRFRRKNGEAVWVSSCDYRPFEHWNTLAEARSKLQELALKDWN